MHALVVVDPAQRALTKVTAPTTVCVANGWRPVAVVVARASERASARRARIVDVENVEVDS